MGSSATLYLTSYEEMKPKRSRSVRPKTKSGSKTRPNAKPVKLLSGDNPQIAKADGDAPVQAYIAAIPGWKRDLGKRLDVIITRNVPNVRKAVKWNSPFYGAKDEDSGWFLNFHCFTNFVRVAFFRGALLEPMPPGASKQRDNRYLDVREGALDEKQFAKWVTQASTLPGERL